MKYKPYSENVWTQINTAIDQALALDPNPIAAFDADGTLWDADLGEYFFNYQIDRKLVPLPPNAWNHYLELKKRDNDPREAYLWLAQINHEKPITQVREWAQKSFQQIEPNPIFSEQQKLITLLLSKNIRVYVVTASVKWAVEPGAIALGLKPENVIGVETEIVEGMVSQTGVLPITYRQGKVDALLKHTDGKLPFLCSGNSMGDFELLKSATHLALAVSAASRDDKLYKTEAELQGSASQFKNFIAHRFIY